MKFSLHDSSNISPTLQQGLNIMIRPGGSVVYYESRKRELKKRCKNEYRYDERLKTKGEESTCLVYTGLYEELEHRKIKTRLIIAKFANVMGEYPI